MTIQLIAIWERDENNNWYNLDEINSVQDGIDGFGYVYVIWTHSDIIEVLKVGQGIFSEKIQEYKNNPLIQKYRESEKINITWAIFPENLLDGVVAYLDYKLKPTLNDKHPSDFLIPIN
ncbi:MAG: hypothetical protein GQ534_02185, partial [Candidatus Delongbacteria bacterium]|nr:hypothetical protein [Candidatus Delongbacteria bacterium]